MYFDTHAHYDDNKFNSDRAEALARAQQAGVELIVNIGCDLTSSLRSLALAREYPFMYAAVGTHPHEAASFSGGDLAIYRTLLADPRVVALGEIGLDYHYDFSPRETQREVFERQMQLAAEVGVPVVIHSREACEDTMTIVRKYADRVHGVFHCYAYSVETAKEIVNLGWYLSFTGAVTFKNARRALEVIDWAPLQRIFIETDCPYLAPEPHRGKRNESAYVPRVAEKIAEVRKTPVEEVARITLENGKRFFGIETEV